MFWVKSKWTNSFRLSFPSYWFVGFWNSFGFFLSVLPSVLLSLSRLCIMELLAAAPQWLTMSQLFSSLRVCPLGSKCQVDRQYYSYLIFMLQESWRHQSSSRLLDRVVRIPSRKQNQSLHLFIEKITVPFLSFCKRNFLFLLECYYSYHVFVNKCIKKQL